jgi:SulP family sulfate permease
LYACGLTLEDAREAGWVAKPQPADHDWRFWKAWRLYGIHDFPPSNIYWHALPSQVILVHMWLMRPALKSLLA